jgi:hypothetical protein
MHRRTGHHQDNAPGGPRHAQGAACTTGGWWHPDAGLLELAPAEQLIAHHAILCGARSGATYVVAESLVVPARLPGVDAERLMLKDASPGRLLAASRLETRREVLRVTAVRAGETADHLDVAPSATLTCRTYRIVVGRRAAAVVTEWLAPGAWQRRRSGITGVTRTAGWRSASGAALADVQQERPPVGVRDDQSFL